MSANLFVANLPYALVDDELAAIFQPYDEVTSAKIIMDRETGKSRGFGFVELASSSAGQRAIDELHGTQVQGRSIVVRAAEPRGQKGGNGRQGQGNRR